MTVELSRVPGNWMEKFKNFVEVEPYYNDRMWELVGEHIKPDQVEIPVVVECGSFRGRWSFWCLSKYAELIGQHFCIDLWDNYKGVTPQFQDEVYRTWFNRMQPWLWDKLHPLRGDSAFWHSIFPYQIDVMYLDAGHSYQFYADNLKPWWDKVRPGGLMIIHDLDEKVRKAAMKAWGKGNWVEEHLGPPRHDALWKVKPVSEE